MKIHGIVPGELVKDYTTFVCISCIFGTIIEKPCSDSFVHSNVNNFWVVFEDFRYFLSNDFFKDSYFFVDLSFELVFRQSFSVDDQYRGHYMLFGGIDNFHRFFVVGSEPVIEDKFKLRVRDVIFSPQTISAVGVNLSLFFVGCADKRYCKFTVQRGFRRGKTSTSNLQIRCELNLDIFVDHFLFCLGHLLLLFLDQNVFIACG